MFMNFFRNKAFPLMVLAATSLACGISVDTGLGKPTEIPPQEAATQNVDIPQPTQIIPTEVIPAPTEEPTLSPNLNFVEFEGVSFSYDKSLAAGVTPEKMAAVPVNPDGAPWEFNPETINFPFSGYILQNTFHDPVIHIYPIADFEAMEARITDRITNLKTLLAGKPPAPETIPFLPTWNAGQVLRANVKYLNFQNGSGVRFLTMYSQSYTPVNNNELFYSFQGLTDDGNYYISAILPVSHPSLPPDSSFIPGGDFDTFANNYPAYSVEITTNLSAQPSSSFSPNLDLLDAAIQSFLIQWSR